MKKIKLIFVLICLLALCTLTLVSCTNQLDTPSGLLLEEETLTLSWQKVEGARFYTVQISGSEKPITTKATKVVLDDLDPGNYEIKIQANGDGESADDSNWAVYNFTRDYETGLKYQLINNGTEYQLIGGGTASGDVVMESTYRGKPVTSIADKALYNNAKITSFTVGANVKTIGFKAFNKCSKLTSVTIPEGVVSIGDNAFQYCKAITSITLPDSVTVINPYLFSNCENLTSVKIGKNTAQISEQAFAKCGLLTSITYNGCENAEYKACLPDTVKIIGTYAFSNCKALPDINLGNSVQVIDTYAFAGCDVLSKINLGTSLQVLADYAFTNCKALNSVVIPDSTTTIGMAAFIACDSLGEITLGKGLTSIGNGAFQSTKLFTDAQERGDKMLIVDGWIIKLLDTTLLKVSVNKDVVGIASAAFANSSSITQADFKGVKYIGYAAFYGCMDLNYVTFDDELIEIGDSAFEYCQYLKQISIGNSVTTISNNAFNNCVNLDYINIPKTVTSIGSRAFRNTKAYAATAAANQTVGRVVYVGDWAVDFIPGTMAALFGEDLITINPGTRGIANYTFSQQMILVIKLPDSVEYIGRGAFNKCASNSINLPKNLKYIGDYAFYNCQYTNFGSDDAYNIVIPEGTEYIGRSAFYGCVRNLSLTVAGTVEYIGPYAFYGCYNLGRTVDLKFETGEKDANDEPIYQIVTVNGFINLGNGVKYIGDRAFQGCLGLVDVAVPDSVTYLGTRVFYKCEGLKNVSIGSGITTIVDYTFYKCTSLEKVTVSDSLETIGNYAFRGCTSLKEFDLKRVKSIGKYAFYGCTAMTSITLPDTLTSVGDYAFRGCKGVESIVIPTSVTNIGKHAFYGLNNATLYCESQTIMPYWDNKFNSSYRPVFWGCTLSDDNKYVVSFTAGDKAIDNALATNGISDPVKDGYTFAGWATEQGSTVVAYTSENVSEAKSGTVLYAVWTQQQNEN